jgi:hypothetical protein
MPKAVVMGATLQCTCGTAHAKLMVNSQTQATIDNKLAATIRDFQPGANILLFGTCKILTAAALGVPTPCAMVPVGPWQPGSTSRFTVADIPVLLSTDKLNCAIPGVISVVNPGQEKTGDS